MTYWGNAQYFLYHKFGRIHGPTTLSGQGIYSDENNFAVLFVTGFPFLYYFGQYLNNRLIKWGASFIILFSWHAVFLTASRGALLGIASVLLMFLMRLEKKAIGLVIIAGFIAAFAWQAGDVMKSRSATITTYQQEDSASARIEAWKAAMGMMAAHPLTGVGFASFGQAFPDFSDIVPRVAHNTFFQIGGEWGVLAGLTYLVLIFSTVNRLRKNRTRLRKMETTDENRLYRCLNESCLLALTGFFVCSMFLSLQAYEVFYYLLVLANATLVCSGYLAYPRQATSSGAARIRSASVPEGQKGKALEARN
jgi:putative inorganic carbon (HCO3(-)) transporter